MMTAARRKIRVLASDESGFALVIVIGLLALLTVVTTGGFFLAQQTLHNSVITKEESQSFQSANAAVDGAIANIQYKGYDSADFPMTFSVADLGSGTATVTVEELTKGEYKLTSIGSGAKQSAETIKVRLYMLDLYGMNIAYGSGFNQGASSGKFNGNASVYGPFYTKDDLRQGENLGMANSGGFGWGPIFIKNGTLDVKSGYLVDVKVLYVDPAMADPKVVSSATRVVRSVPTLTMPSVDAAYLDARYEKAKSESSDNIQGDPDVRTNTNTEVTTVGSPSTYTGSRSAGAGTYYKIIDNDGMVNKSSSGLTLGSASFGNTNDDFAYNASTRQLTVWGTVFIDGPLTTSNPVNYVGNGTLVVNGKVTLNGDFLPLDGLVAGEGGDGVTYANQSFNPDRIIGISSSSIISLDNSSGGNAKNPDGAPTHAGAFFANDKIVVNAKVLLCGSLISQGIQVEGLNNMDLRTSANLGKYVPRSMPGYGMLFQSIGAWSRR